MFFEEYINFNIFRYLKRCAAIPVLSFGSHIRLHLPGLGLNRCLFLMAFFFLTLKVKNILLWFAKHEEFKSFLIFLLALCSFLTKLYVPFLLTILRDPYIETNLTYVDLNSNHVRCHQLRLHI